MKVDVYPNITNVEVYENPISVPVEATWEKVVFTVPDPIVNNYDLGRQVATDRDGDYVIQVHYDSTEVDYATDFTVTDTKINWVSATALVVGQKITVWYSPKSAYGSVPGSGEVTSLTHLNDVTVAGPLPGQLLMRDGNNQFVNRSLTAGDNVSITSDGDGITIASGVVNQVNASTITSGIVRLATVAEAAGISQALAITPKGLQEELSDLSTVATSGSYADLSNTPTIPTSLSGLSDVSLSGTLSVGEVMRYNGSTFVDSKLASTDLSDTADLALLDSPALTGTPTAPTPAVDDSSTKVATTAYVQTEISGLATASQGNAGNVNVTDGSGGFSSSTWEVNSNHLVPTVNESYDIGSANKRVRDIYLSNNSLKFGANNLSLALNNQGKLTFDSDLVLTDETFATVASTGAYSDLVGAPTLSNVATSGAYADLSGKPTLATVATSGSYADLSNLPSLATVATSGSFADLQNTPTASTTTSGIVELATLQETSTGTDATKAVTPAGLAAELSGVGTSDKVFEGQAKVEAFDDGSVDGAVIKFSVDPNNTGSPVDVWHIDGDGHMIPQAHEAYDLGKADAKVRHLFLSDNSIKMGDSNKAISLSGARLNYDGNNVTTDNLLSDVATSGSYADLSNKPTIPSASTDLTDTADLARLASPGLTGTPTAPTANSGTNTTQIATTAFVRTEVAGIVGGVTYKGTINVADFAATLVNAEQGDFYKIATGGTASDNRVYATNDSILINTDMGGTYSDAKVDKIDNTEAVTSVNSLTGAISLSANDLPADHTATNYTAANANIDGHLSGIDSALNTLGSHSLNNLSDVSITGASTGEVLRYNGSAWVDTQLAYSDVSGTPSLGTSASLDVGTGASNIVQLDGSANLPAVNGAALTGITANQVGALSTLNNQSLSDLGDVAFTAGAGINGYSLVYNHGNTQWEAEEITSGITTVLLSSSNLTQHSGSNNASVTVTAGNNYVIDPSAVNATNIDRLFLTVPTTGVDDPKTTTVVNLSALPVYIRVGSNNVLYDALGNVAPYVTQSSGLTGYMFQYGKGTIDLHQSDSTSTGSKWYAYFTYPIENEASPSEGDGFSFSGKSKAYINAGHLYGDYLITSDIADSQLRSGRRYVTAYNETTDRIVNLPEPYGNSDDCSILNSKRIYFINRGSANLTIKAQYGGFVGGVYYSSFFRNFVGTTLSANQVLLPGESCVLECEYISGGNPTIYYNIQRQGHTPERLVETDSSGTNSTVTTSTEQHKVLLVDNGGSAVTLTLPQANVVKPNYKLTVLNRDAGVVTVSRGGSNDLINASTSVTLNQYNSLDLVRTSSGWSIIQPKVSVAAGDVSGLSTVATSGSYADLSNKPTIPSAINDLSDVTITGASPGEVIRYNGSAWVDAQLTYSDVSGTPTLSTVATSGSYNDLSNKPTLGTAAALDTGVANGDVIVADATGLPVIDGSQLTNVTATDATKQPLDAGLTSISGLTTSADKMIYCTASDTYAVTSITSAGRDLIADADIATQRTTLGLGTAAIAASTEFLSGTGADALGGDLDVGGHDIVSSSNGAINLAPDGSGVVTILGNTGGSGQIKLNCENNSHGVTIKGPPHSASATYTLTLPNDDGGADQVLKSNGSGVLSWTDQASGGSAPVVAEQNTTATLSDPSSGVIEQIYTVSSGSSVTLTLALSATVGEGFKYQIKRLGTGAVTLTCGGSEYIDHSGQTSFAIPNQYDSITLVANGTSPASWLIV